MGLAEILKMGHPLLQTPCREVQTFNCPALDSLAERLLATREHYQGAGVAAPQIGVDQRVICFGGKTKRYPGQQVTPARVLVNPSYHALDDALVDGWEGCLSVPGLRGLVPRYKTIKYSGYDLDGVYVEGVAEAFEARILQHEIDHLEGVLFPQRLKDLMHFGYEEELAVIS